MSSKDKGDHKSSKSSSRSSERSEKSHSKKEKKSKEEDKLKIQAPIGYQPKVPLDLKAAIAKAVVNTNGTPSLASDKPKNFTFGSNAGHQIIHTFEEEETVAFSAYISSLLKYDNDLQTFLPIDQFNLFEVVSKGTLLCKLINTVKPGVIDTRRVHVNPRNTFETIENHNMSLSAAKAIGCNIINVDGIDLNEKKPHLILGLIWQILKFGLLSKVSIESHPELAGIFRSEDELKSLVQTSAETNLLKWVNYHMKRVNCQKQITNFSEDVKNSEIYLILMNSIAPDVCDKSALNEPEMLKRAELMLKEAEKLNCHDLLTPQLVVDGNKHLNLAFVANLFDKHPAISALNEKEKEKQGIERAKNEEIKRRDEDKRKLEEEEMRTTLASQEKLRVEREVEENRKLENKKNELEKIEKKLKEDEVLMIKRKVEEEEKKRTETLKQQEGIEGLSKQKEQMKAYMQQREEDEERVRREYVMEREREWKEYQTKLSEFERLQISYKEEKEKRELEIKSKAEDKKKVAEEEDQLIQDRNKQPIVLWFIGEAEEAKSNPTPIAKREEEIHLLKHGLNVLYCSSKDQVLEEIKKNKKVLFLVTDFYQKEGSTSVAIGLNISNIIREELQNLLPIICYSDRVRKDPKLQQMCKDAGMKPVMRGQSFYKLLGVPEPPLKL